MNITLIALYVNDLSGNFTIVLFTQVLAADSITGWKADANMLYCKPSTIAGECDMAFSWSEQSIRWFLDASAYTGFHRELARILLPFLNRGESFCDLGCGLGRVDLALAPHLDHVSALDVDEQVLAILRADAAREGVRIQTICGDIRDAQPLFDVVMLSFFGRSGLERYLAMCRRLLIRVVNADNDGNLYPRRHRKRVKTTISDVQADLAGKGYPCRLLEYTLEFGQPLRSQEDAVAFLAHHAPEAPMEELHNFLEQHAVQTGREDFPLYLPNTKRIGVFLIKKTAE